MSQLKVSDQYRTNPLSLKPGGYTVTAVHETGKIFIYDKVKNPGAYIKSMSTEQSEHGAISEVLIDNKSVWTQNCGRSIWEI
jgi:hypothetical protein